MMPGENNSTKILETFIESQKTVNSQIVYDGIKENGIIVDAVMLVGSGGLSLLAKKMGQIAGKSVVASGVPKYLYHYTSKGAAQSISKSGLRVGKDGFHI